MIVHLVVERDRLVDVMSQDKLDLYLEELRSRYKSIEYDEDWTPDERSVMRKTISGGIPEGKKRIPVVRITRIVVDGTFF